MNKIIISMAMLLALGITPEASAQRHHDKQRVEATTTNAAKASSQHGEHADEEEGIEAYSDTSSVASADDDSISATGYSSVDDSNRYSPKRFDDPLSWLGYMFSSNFFGGLMGTLMVVFVLLFLLSPLIILIIVLRYIIRRHNDRVRLAEMAMQNGQPLTDEQMPLSRKSPSYMWRRGVRNVSIGLGLMAFLWFLGAYPLVGIGALIACLGAGQMFMVRYNYNSSFRRGKRNGMDNNTHDTFGNFGDDTDDNSNNQ